MRAEVRESANHDTASTTADAHVRTAYPTAEAGNVSISAIHTTYGAAANKASRRMDDVGVMLWDGF